VFLAFLLAFFLLSLAETAVALHRDGRPAYRLTRLLSPFKYACVIAVAISGVFLALSIQPLGPWPTALLSLLILVILAGLDRAGALLASRYPDVLRRFSRPLTNLLLGRFQALAIGGASGQANGAGQDGAGGLDREEQAIPQELMEGLDQRDREMVGSILRLDDSTAHEIMVPRLDMAAVEVNVPIQEAVRQVIESVHSRLPVYEETLDRVIGIVHALEIMQALYRQEQEEISLRGLLRPAYFIPETKRLDELLDELQGQGIQMAIVVDEYGGVEGLLTIEDLLEEIVGEIEDEFSSETEPEVVRLPDGAVLVDARLNTEEVEEIFGTRIPDEDVDTVGGYVYRTLGRIPQTGDTVSAEDLRIEVVSILGRRLRKLRIDRISDKGTPNTLC
jgi:CBS domain containing-hemolysin-like protein